MTEPHWHEFNPWKDELVYVPIEALAACSLRLEDPTSSWDMIDAIAYWAQYGDKLDAYIVNGVELMGGVRYEPEPEHYLSPALSLPKLYGLLQDYVPTPRKDRRNTSSP